MVSRRNQQPTLQEIRKTARAAVAVLDSLGFDSCLFGSAACSTYGMKNRVPGDVDIVVLTKTPTDDIKRSMVARDDNFYLRPSTNPNNTYSVLYYTLPRRWRSCKVDILIPGELSIPPIPPQSIQYTHVPGIPVMPFLPLLLLKLRGWTDHCRARQWHKRRKIPNDEADIAELLQMAINFQIELRTERRLRRRFLDESMRRIGKYISEHPDSAWYWWKIGFDVPQ